MADETTILLDEGSPDDSSLQMGLDSNADDATTVVDGAAETAPQPTEPTAAELRAEIDELKQRNDQYLRERKGWETQSRKNLDDRNALAERLARLEGRLESTAGTSHEAAPPSELSPGRFKSALRKWIDEGDESDLDAVDELLSRNRVAPQEVDIAKIIDGRLADLGQRAGIKQVAEARHQELQNPASPLSVAVWEEYDTYASDRANQILFPPEERYNVPLTGPNGESRLVDGRMLNMLATDLKLRSGVQAGRQQEQRASLIGSVTGGNGRQTQTPRGRHVEAISLLTEGEKTLLQDPKIRKGYPGIPEDPKAAAKFFFDTLTPAERTTRLRAYRQASRSGGA